ncbi:FAD-dependent oxidoreductase [Rhodobacterales bacterium HKCCE2091]|nr:FAD-dependent oxidoreductase [Rhodobacterales bacterium HKCCE2091]
MDHDFIIIGGGIAGVSAAARLAAIGRVLLLEGEAALGYHASGRSAALFEENYGLPTTVELNRASSEYHETVDGGVLSRRGFLLVGAHDDALFEADMATLAMREIAVEDAIAKVPILDSAMVTRAAYHADAWDIDTDRLLQSYARAARSNGAIRLSARVDSIARTGTGWRVTAAGEGFEAPVVVNAAGAWADTVALMAGVAPLGIVPHRRSMARIPAPGGFEVSAWPMVLGPGESWYAKPDAGALLVSPAEEDPMEPHDAWADDMVLAEGLARYEAHVTEPVTRLLASWAGLRSFAPDRQLVIGFDPDNPGFFWLAGQGGYGIQSSPAASRLAADLIGGTAPELAPDVVAALDPARLRA